MSRLPHRRRRGALLWVAALLLATVPLVSQAAIPPRPRRLVTPMVAGEVLAGFDTPAGSAALLERAGVDAGRALRGRPDVRLFHVPRGREALTARRLQSLRGVHWAAPNFLAHAAVAPNDPAYALQWNLGTRDRAIGAADWQPVNGTGISGKGVAVAVLDSGVTANFELDQVSGYDFIDNDPNPSDPNGHGTHVAGTIAQSTNNGVGTAGVAPDAAILAVRVLDSAGSGSYAQILEGLAWAVDHGARVVNLSLSGDRDGGLCDGVARAVGRGTTVVVAAGNTAGAVAYPAACPAAIGVSATTLQGQLASYSNRGPQISLAAPGGDTSADVDFDGEPDGILQYTVIDGHAGYYFFSGTSMAAPHVAGAAALLLQRNPALSPAQVKAVLTSTALDLGVPGADASFGAGLLDISAAIASLGGAAAPETRSLSPSAPPPTGEAPTSDTQAAPSRRVDRLSGANRYATSVLVSQAGWSGTAPRVYLVSGRQFPDALAAGAFSEQSPGPILLTEPCSLPSEVGDELARLSPSEVVVVGGERAVCTQVALQAALRAQTTFRRVAGADRYQTAAALAQEGWSTAPTVYLASGAGFADALGGGASAAHARGPLLLTGSCELPATTADELRRLAPSRVVVLGGPTVVCDGVLAAAQATLPAASVVRVSGRDRYDTSASLAAANWPLTTPVVFVASGADFPDGLAAGPLAAVRDAPLLLVASCSVPDVVHDEIGRLDPERVVVLGGATTVCEAVDSALGG